MNQGKSLRFLTMGLTRLWRRHGWLIIGFLWIFALALGYLGFALIAPATGRSSRFLDVTYRVIQLIPMNSGDIDGANWSLNTARFLIPFLAAWTAVRALLSLLGNRWQQFFLRFWRDHVIICGLSRKGWLLAQGFTQLGNRVVMIEANQTHDLIGHCRERGIVILVGDATDPGLLRRAGVQRSSHLIAVTEDDGVNAEIAVRVQNLLKIAAQVESKSTDRRFPVNCTIHLVDPQLHELARTREMGLEVGVPFRLELFNVFERGARLLWSQFGPAIDGREEQGGVKCSFSIVVIGLGCLGESLVVYAARDWHTRLNKLPCRETGRLHITVVDQDADWKCRALSLRYPKLASVCVLVPMKMNVRWPEFYEGAFLISSPDIPAVDAVFVCFDNDSLGLRTGLAICRHFLQVSANPPPIVVRMAEAKGLASLVEPSDSGVATFTNIHAFGLLDRTCTPEAIIGGTHEVLARGLHGVYVEQQRALGHTAETNPSLVEWDLLPEVLRASNRAESDAIFLQLASIGYTLMPLTDWDATSFLFSEAEVMRLAEIEHTRFVAERSSKGWHYINGLKDIDALLNPTLVPWAELPEDERIKTYEAVRKLPIILARAGFQITRIASVDQPIKSSPL